MACFAPLKAWQSQFVNPSGKRPLTFDYKDAYSDLQIEVPCGYCIGCRLDRARQWTIRCMHEASLHDDNCFVTLTYENNPYSLQPKDMTDFLKRLRESINPTKIRYMQVGEYGDNFGRPHHHMILFGWRPQDLEAFSGGDYPVLGSQMLRDLWGHGFVSVGDVTTDSIAYVCRYTLKKLGVDKSSYAGRKPEYITMSRCPGIGAEWFDKFKDDLFLNGTVLLNGNEVKAPRFYDDRLEQIDKKILVDIKRQRFDNSIKKSPSQNYVSTQVAKIRQARKKRSVDHGDCSC